MLDVYDFISSGVRSRVVQTPFVQVVMVPVEPEILTEVLEEVVVLPEDVDVDVDLLDELEDVDWAEATPAPIPIRGVAMRTTLSARRIRPVFAMSFTIVSFRAEWSVQPASISETGRFLKQR